MKVEKSTIIRTALLVFALINQALNMAGKSTLPFTEDEVSSTVAFIITAGSSLYAWWKNNSFTTHAIKADEHLKSLKSTSDSSDESETTPENQKEDETTSDTPSTKG